MFSPSTLNSPPTTTTAQHTHTNTHTDPWRLVADVPVPLHYLTRMPHVAWEDVDTGKRNPYCAGKRRKGDGDSDW